MPAAGDEGDHAGCLAACACPPGDGDGRSDLIAALAALAGVAGPAGDLDCGPGRLLGMLGQVGDLRDAREFACWLAACAPEVTSVAGLRRRHIEAYKLHLASRPSARGGKLSRISLAEHLGGMRACFERLIEWDGDDVPAAVLVFSGDLPLRDEPLPRFLDDGAFTKLLQATRADPDPFVHLAVEFLARTGLRKGEFLDLTVDSVVQIGAAYWLHVPLGKLRTDRYIPLHPQLKDLLDAWLAGRPASLRTPWPFTEHGQRIGPGRVDRAVAKTARAAGIGHVSPHRLRHALATQFQPGHEPRSDSRPSGSSVDADDHGLCEPSGIASDARGSSAFAGCAGCLRPSCRAARHAVWPVVIELACR